MKSQKKILLLINLGSPDAPDKQAVKKYLKQFLSDRRVIGIPQILWQPILRGIILNIRPQKSARNYQKIWGEHQTAPLIRACQAISTKLQSQLPQTWTVKLAMSYGQPAIDKTLSALPDMDDLVVLPMYPQFSSATTASVFDAICHFYHDKKNIPHIKFIRDYHCNSAYINALARSVTEFRQQNGAAEVLLISFHGLPQVYIDKGDPYQQQCETSCRLMVEKLGLNDKEYRLCYQSRFGKQQWLVPSTVDTLRQLAANGIKSVDVISPGFSVDCVETLEELALSAKEVFLGTGGEKFSYIPCLNLANVGVFERVID